MSSVPLSPHLPIGALFGMGRGREKEREEMGEEGERERWGRREGGRRGGGGGKERERWERREGGRENIMFQFCTMAPLRNLPTSKKLNGGGLKKNKTLHCFQLIFTGLRGKEGFQGLNIYKCYCCPPTTRPGLLREVGRAFHHNGVRAWV